MAEAKITQVNPTSFELEEYSVADENLISSIEIETLFAPQTDYIEYFVYNPNNGGQVYPPFDSPANSNDYTLEDNILVINPENGLFVNGFEEGTYNTPTKNIVKISVKEFENVPIHHTQIKHKTEII